MKLSDTQYQLLVGAIAEQPTMSDNTNRTLLDANDKTLQALEKRGLVTWQETNDTSGYVVDGKLYAYRLTPAAYEIVNTDDIAYARHKAEAATMCPKCGGKGYIREYAHVAGGVCFACNGTGKRKRH